MTSFENFGVRKDIANGARMKCGICWIGYDLAEGDEATQIAAGMPFAGLPDNGVVANFNAPKSKFMAIEDDF
ncbi:rubredoxin [Bradyrhizobium australiense]|uniref:Rubredoxin n=1 Tax=Bradyrhizobium australiense TaxID=2721161 RepID=A0A7Y4LWI2_9BRAD|nr:rubredoxin [Bradyrhizobium australiense]NOJ41458.1 rubredoxin [Bradyrhizobium australiense]